MELSVDASLDQQPAEFFNYVRLAKEEKGNQEKN
jgi:hypothetical protein